MKKSEATALGVGLAVIAFIIFCIYLFLVAMIDKLNSINGELGKALITASVTLIVAIVTLVGGKIWETKMKIKHDIRDKKILAYEGMLNLFFDVLMHEKLGRPAPEGKEFVEKFTELTKKLITWGSPEVIKAWIEFKKHQWTPESTAGGMLKVQAVLIAIRKDIGNDCDVNTGGNLMHLFINDYDKVAVSTAPASTASQSPVIAKIQNTTESASPRI